MSRHQPYRPPLPQIPADPLCGNPCDSRDPRSHVPPLKGLRETLTASVSYRASVPAGHAYCEVASSHRALAPAADRQNRSFKALSGKGSAPATPPPFRHTPFRPWPRHSAPVWRNPGQHPHRDGTFTFSAKEKDPETGLSYFGSRYYSSDLSVWLSVDPMSDKYPSLSPYTYCADNPVKLVDPNGEAFDTEIDETTQTITIHAVYYTTTKDAVQLKKELDAWKKKGESYSYISDGKGYSIRFNLEIKDFDDVNEAINKFTENKDDGISNYFQINKTVENPNHEKANGINYEGNNMYVAKGQIRSIRHEIGHSLGLGDWNYGLMKSGGAIYGISKNNIISIFESAGIKSLIHNSLGDWNSRQTDPVCTSKTVHNKSGLFKRKHNQR